MLIRQALSEGCAALAAAGKGSPGLDASLLLAEVLGTSRTALAAAGEDELPQKALDSFRLLIGRRLGGECVAYILGRKEFRGLEFSVNKSVLVPRPETETLVEAALEVWGIGNGEWGVKNRSGKTAGNFRVLDLCTGSGAVAVSLKSEWPDLTVWASDISAKALKVARANAARLLPPESICFFLGDLFEALPNPQSPFPIPQFNLIVSNPPYIPGAQIETLSPEVKNEPRIALDGGEDGLAIIKGIIAAAPDYLIRGGALLLEADPGQMKNIAGLLEKNGFMNIKEYRDLSGSERVIGGTLS
ncbi:MAG: peptide chain release factor N(5)-glutamine methyltransferase [Treponema sp.]|nr:peptide chain release factor N(5)-glutamine methyltransferase [Treponema sp.]